MANEVFGAAQVSERGSATRAGRFSGRLSQMSHFQTQQNLMAIVCSFQKKAHSSADF